MINIDELLYVVDEFDVAQSPLSRHKTHTEKHWHRAAHVWIVNDQNQLLCQKRSQSKETAPGMWEPCVGGHIGPGDDYFSGAVKEVQEETGLPVTRHDLKLVKIYQDFEHREFRAVFVCRKVVGAGSLRSEESEVDEIAWMDLEHLIESSDQNWIRTGYEQEIFSLLREIC